MTTEMMEEIDTAAQAAQLAKLQQMEAEANATDAASWKAIKLAFAKGQDIDLAEVRRLGKTVADLEAAAKNYQHRLELDAERRLKGTAEKTIQKCNLDQREEVNRINGLLKEHQQKMAAIESERNRATQQLIDASDAESDLLETCGDPEPLAEMKRCEQRWDEIPKEQRDVRQQLDLKRNALAGYKERARPNSFGQTAIESGDKDAIVRLTEEVETLATKFESLRIEGDTLNSVFMRAKAKSFDPELI